MKIAGVSMTYNDGYKLDDWYDHYLTYKEQLDVFIIVDNGSEADYLNLLKKTFTDAIIIERDKNGGCTAAYNDGIKYALDNTDVDAIAVIGNDIKLTKKCLPEMYSYLFGDKDLGIVSTAILYKDSEIIDNFGHKLTGLTVKNCNQGENIHKLTCKSKYTELISGGFTMAKREFYLKAGLQDEKLFMYCDELDTMYKAQSAGFKIGVISNEYAWHWHINPPNKAERSNASRFLITRNRIYISKKYANKFTQFKVLIRCLFYVPFAFVVRAIRSKDSYYLESAKYSIMGVLYGLRNNMEDNKYMQF